MSTTAFLQKFEGGNEAVVALDDVLPFLSEHSGVEQPDVSAAIALPAGIANSVRVIGDGQGGVLCLSLTDPSASRDFQDFAFEAMVRFGFSLFFDDLATIYSASPDSDDIPKALLRDSVNGVKRVYRANQIG
ncbi:hypothetical protein [Amantichitinum ursilacus]|uniref:Uncharacterized protein n=1 Tax=Amantichitinum ursilacus TaxID=857265 RepID=A0A0N0GQ21_9NEIS|nr:hypothetical protein [Amantichitinum ursilacus]KPC54222.1 hypothetical protein WG78_06220 [Amantichitinum ursilacus]